MAQYYYSDRQVRTEDLVDGAVTPAKLSFGTWEKIAEVELTSTVASVEFTGLDGDNDKFYLVVVYFVNADSGNPRVCAIRFNNDSGTNYNNQYISGDGTSVSAGSNTGATVGSGLYAKAGAKVVGFYLIHAVSGQVRVAGLLSTYGAYIKIAGITWTNTTDNLTSITLLCPDGAYLGAGSRFVLFRLSQ